MNKRALHHLWTKIRPFSWVYFLIAAGLLLGVGVLAMRQNNLTAISLRDKLLVVDQQDGDVELALRELREHIYSHMNSELGGSNVQQPIQLKYRYERLINAEKERVTLANAKAARDAEEICERRYGAGQLASGRVQCVEQYLVANSLKEQPINDSLYKFDFASPRWSADLAGISLVLSAIFLLLAATRLLLERWMRSNMSDHM
jgi:hypothetical protein